MYNGYTYEPTKEQQESNERETLITLALTGNPYWINRLNAALEKQRKEEAQTRAQAEQEFQDNFDFDKIDPIPF